MCIQQLAEDILTEKERERESACARRKAQARVFLFSVFHEPRDAHENGGFIGERRWCLMVPPYCLASCVPASQSAVECDGSGYAGLVYVRSTHCSANMIDGVDMHMCVCYFGSVVEHVRQASRVVLKVKLVRIVCRASIGWVVVV